MQLFKMTRSNLSNRSHFQPGELVFVKHFIDSTAAYNIYHVVALKDRKKNEAGFAASESLQPGIVGDGYLLPFDVNEKDLPAVKLLYEG